MLLSEMVEDIYGALGNRFQVSPQQIVRKISFVQDMAFNANIKPFAVLDTILTPTAGVDSVLSRGPYGWPSNSRLVVGVSTSDCVDLYSLDDILVRGLVPGRISIFNKTFTFSSDLVEDEEIEYRWVYYRRPEELTSVADNAKILIPREWHDQVLVAGTTLLCDRGNYGEKVQKELRETVLEPFWAAMTESDSSAPTVSEGNW